MRGSRFTGGECLQLNVSVAEFVRIPTSLELLILSRDFRCLTTSATERNRRSSSRRSASHVIGRRDVSEQLVF
jgi:hypothetical protein